MAANRSTISTFTSSADGRCPGRPASSSRVSALAADGSLFAVGEGSSLLTDFARAEPLTALVRSAHSRVSWSQSRVRCEAPRLPGQPRKGTRLEVALSGSAGAERRVVARWFSASGRGCAPAGVGRDMVRVAAAKQPHCSPRQRADASRGNEGRGESKQGLLRRTGDVVAVVQTAPARQRQFCLTHPFTPPKFISLHTSRRRDSPRRGEVDFVGSHNP